MEKYFTLTECVGYLASAAILVSFLMKNIKYLRIINFFGCGFFVTYGFLIDSWPVIVSNIAIAGIHVYYLRKLSMEQKQETEVLNN